MKKNIYLIDDESPIRDSLSILFSTMGWHTYTFESAQAFSDYQSVTSQMVGCILLDMRMPGKTGLVLLDELQKQALSLPVIIMTGHGNIEACRRAFKNGAFDFLTKPIDADLLIESVSAAFREFKERYHQYQSHQILVDKFKTLSEREQEVIELIVAGQTNKEIARVLSLSPRTVEAHRANIFAKLEVSSLAQLVKEYSILTQTHYR